MALRTGARVGQGPALLAALLPSAHLSPGPRVDPYSSLAPLAQEQACLAKAQSSGRSLSLVPGDPEPPTLVPLNGTMCPEGWVRLWRTPAPGRPDSSCLGRGELTHDVTREPLGESPEGRGRWIGHVTPMLQEQETGKWGQDPGAPPQPIQLVSWAHLAPWRQGTTGTGLSPGARGRPPGTGLRREGSRQWRGMLQGFPGVPREGESLTWGAAQRDIRQELWGHQVPQPGPCKVLTSHPGGLGLLRGSGDICLDLRWPRRQQGALQPSLNCLRCGQLRGLRPQGP